MGYPILRTTLGVVLELAAAQHNVVTRAQLLDLGMHPQAIKHRLARGRLYVVYPGVYSVGTPMLSREGSWMAAVLACGEGAALSHDSAAELWRIRKRRSGATCVSIPGRRRVRRPGVRVRRCTRLGPADVTIEDGIPVTTPARTLIDIAPSLADDEIGAAISQADALNLVTPAVVETALDDLPYQQPGVASIRRVLSRSTFALTDSHLERLFLPIAKRAGLPRPRTREWVNGLKVDFFWPDLGLVVETDGLRYHRTPTQQAIDHRRDQTHTAAGLTPLRFTHDQVAHEADIVETILRETAARLRGAARTIR